MSPEAQRIAIAEACGWSKIRECTCKRVPRGTHTGKDVDEHLPDYLNDLNAMHEAEKVLERLPGREEYAAHLCRIVLDIDMGDDLTVCLNLWALRRLAKATAAQRAEAFLRTLNLWKL